MIARIQRLKDSHRCRHTRRKCCGGNSTLELGHAGFEHPSIGVIVADVIVAACEAAIGASAVRRGHIDRRNDRAATVVIVSSMDRQRLESHATFSLLTAVPSRLARVERRG